MLLMRRKNFSYLFVQCVYIHWSNFWKFWSNVIDFRLKWKLFKMCFSIYSYKSRNIREISFTLFVGRNYHENGTKTNNTFLRLNMLLMSRVTNNTFIPKKMLLMRRKNFSYLFVQCVYIHWSNFWKFWSNVIDFRLKWKLFKMCFSIYSYKSRNIREISFTLFVGRNYHENGTKTNNTFLRLNMLLMSRVTNSIAKTIIKP